MLGKPGRASDSGWARGARYKDSSWVPSLKAPRSPNCSVCFNVVNMRIISHGLQVEFRPFSPAGSPAAVQTEHSTECLKQQLVKPVQHGYSSFLSDSSPPCLIFQTLPALTYSTRASAAYLPLPFASFSCSSRVYTRLSADSVFCLTVKS